MRALLGGVTAVCVYERDITYTHQLSSLFGMAPIFGPIQMYHSLSIHPLFPLIHDRSRSSGIFGQSVAQSSNILHLPCRLFWIRSAYYSLISFSVHVESGRAISCMCVSVHFQTQGISDGNVDATWFHSYVFWRNIRKRKQEECASLFFSSVHMREFIYNNSAFTRSVRTRYYCRYMYISVEIS